MTILKKCLFVFLILLAAGTVSGQMTEADKEELYPAKYTFEKASQFEEKGEYEKAVWFYINLFPENKSQAIEQMKAIAAKLDTTDMSFFIKKSFAMYATFDPTVMTFTKGMPEMNMEMLKLKGSWGDELIQKISDPDKPLTSASEYNFRAQDKAKAGDFEGAVEDYSKSIEISPSGEGYFNRGYCKSEMEDFSGAISDYNKAIEMQYGIPNAYFERGYCKDNINDTTGAIEDYTKAIEADKTYADAYNNRAVMSLKTQHFKEAIKDFNKAIKCNPGYAAAYVNRGFAKKALNDDKSACKDWEKAYELGFTQAQQIMQKYCQ